MQDFYLSPALARAARGLLAWQQADLAAAAGLSLTAIKNFEGGKKKVHKETARAVQNAFERNGVEFPPSGGLRQADEVSGVLRFSGPSFLRKWYEDLYAAVRNPNEEILTSSIGEHWWDHPSVSDANEGFLKWQKRLQIAIKVLTPEALRQFNLPRRCYRVVPPELLGKVTYCLYADRLAFIIWRKQQIIVLRNALVAQTFRSQFLYLWRMGRAVGND